MEKNNIKTFEDLYNYISNAEVDYYGYHEINNKLRFHIYSNKHQCNIINSDINGDDIPYVAICFRPDEGEVSLYNVNRDGCADYSNPYVIPFNSPVNEFGNCIRAIRNSRRLAIDIATALK